MQGDLVIVRAFRGKPLVRRVWDKVGHGVYITDDAHFKRLLAGEKISQPVGFPREDVFRYDPDLARRKWISYTKPGNGIGLNWFPFKNLLKSFCGKDWHG